MSRIKFRIRYYSIYNFKEEYFTCAASTYSEAVEDLDDITKQGALPIGVYDIQDWRLYWKLIDSIQQSTHYDRVLEITNSLRIKHESD